MKVLVTGGAGFIGSHIVDFLLEKNIKVRVLDNLSNGKISNIEHNMKNKNFEFMVGDVTNISDVEIACDGIDAITHQAGIYSVKKSIDDPMCSHNININGFFNVLLCAKKKNIKRVILASSMTLYGDNDILPNKEEHISKPNSPYSITKYTCELYAKNFTDLFNMECISLRYFNVFGPRQEYDSVYATIIPRMINMMKNGINPQINGDGSYIRDFTYVKNIVNANYLALTTQNKDCFGEAINIGTGKKITMISLFNKIKQELKLEIEPLYCPVREGDIKETYADISKAKKLLNYDTEIDFNKGLEITIKYYKNIL